MPMDMDRKIPDFTVAEGPEGLRQLLNNLPNAKDFFILYHLNNQESLIKVDMSERPFHFCYYDLQGRPATNGVKAAISEFLVNKFGIKETDNAYFHDLFKSSLLLKASQGEATFMLPYDRMEQGFKELLEWKKPSALKRVGLFSSGPAASDNIPKPDTPTLK